MKNPHVEDFADEYRQQVRRFITDIHQELGYPYHPHEHPDIEDPRTCYIKTGGCFYLLLEGKRLLGTTGIRKIGERTVELKSVYLLPAYRGLGFGSQLVEKALSFCRERGFKVCTLDTNLDQTVAQNLYKKYCFEVYKQTATKFFMSLNLD
jgi:ribosomal protein S18 acetylase RimI-like enzyme